MISILSISERFFHLRQYQWSQNVGAEGPQHRDLELIVSSSFNQHMAVERGRSHGWWGLWWGPPAPTFWDHWRVLPKISEGSAFTILHESLGTRKFFSKWVPRLLTLVRKQQRVEDLERCSYLLKRGKKDFLHRYVTMDETWFHHYTPKTKRSSAEWTAAGESRPKWPKTQQRPGKVMTSVFWDARGILFIDNLEKDKTINSDYYMALLDRLSAKMNKTASRAKEKSAVPPRQCTVP